MVAFNSLNPFASGPSATSEITQLRIYPIKSCRGIKITNSYLTRQGLDLDRRWMFADASTNKFLTIRDISEMTLIDTALTEPAGSPHTGRAEDQHLKISIRGTDKSVTVPARPSKEWLSENTTLSPVTIWNSNTDGYVYKDEINAIFSEFFGRKVVLVYKGPTPRYLQGNADAELLGRKETTNFPDVMPLLIGNEASIRELNKRLADQGHDEISIENFRPNIVVRGASNDIAADNGVPKAWSEDDWKLVRIVDESAPSSWLSSPHSIDIDVSARCARCQVPNVNPETAEKHPHQPWDTLVSYRRVDEGIKYKPCFGMLCVPRSEGRLAVGMKFQVLQTTDQHKYIKGF